MDTALHNALQDQVASILKEERLMLALERQIAAFAENPGGVEYIMLAEQMVSGMRKSVEKRKRALVKLSKTDPLFLWVKETQGLGPAMLILLGRMPNLQLFANPQRVWKWCGLHVDAGKAPRKRVGSRLGFDPLTKSIAIKWVGEPMMKKRGAYRTLYDEARATKPEWTTGHAHWHGLRKMVKKILVDAWCVDHGFEPWCVGAPTGPDALSLFAPRTLTAV